MPWYGDDVEGSVGGPKGKGGGGGEGGGPSGGNNNTSPTPGTFLACAGGICKEYPSNKMVSPEARQACLGKRAGDPCNMNYTPVPAGGCPEGVGPKAYEGCPCGEAYGTTTGTCANGYKFVRRDPWQGAEDGVVYKQGYIGTCHCQKAIADWKANKSGKGMGEFNWSPELNDLWGGLLERAGGVLNMPYGYSQEAKDYMFGQNFEKIRGQEAGQREGLTNVMSRMGLLGTGTELGTLGKLGWQTEQQISDLMRDLFVKEEEQKKADTVTFTTLAQRLAEGGAGFEQLREALNAARRGERNTALMMLLQLYGLL